MSLSLKKEKMIEYLQDAKKHDENFECMLWGTIYADNLSFKNRSAMSKGMVFTAAPGVSGSLNQAFCYIGMTEKSFYAIALDAYDTSKIIGTFYIPYTSISSLHVQKAILTNTHRVMIDFGDIVTLTVKGISLGTDINDQKERMADFLAAARVLQSSLPLP
ncbi:MAG: hypothetical protein FWG30_05430 [Eubacteriaceae bacterium]|nr:hypothetical protein [Eubacteriaceae bacterium]